MKFATSCFLLLVAAGAAPKTASGDEAPDSRKLSELLQEARQQYMQKHYAASNRVYAEVLKRLPAPPAPGIDTMHGRIHYNMACNHAMLKDKPQALEHLEKAIERGVWDSNYMAKDPTLRFIQGSEEFKALVAKARRARARMAFGMTAVTGEKLDPKDYEGKVMIIDVWGTWCPPCLREIPHFVRLQEKYRDRGLRIIGLTWEKQEPDAEVRKRVRDFVVDNKVNYPCVLLNRRLKAALPDVSTYPTTFFVDRRGHVRERFVGARDYRTLERAALKLLEEDKAP